MSSKKIDDIKSEKTHSTGSKKIQGIRSVPYKAKFTYQNISAFFDCCVSIIDFYSINIALLDEQESLGKVKGCILRCRGVFDEIEDKEKMYRVFYSMFINIYDEYRLDIIKDISLKGNVQDGWLLGNGNTDLISMVIGQNQGKPLYSHKIQLSSIYNYGIAIKEQYKEKSSYKEQVKYADYMLLFIYRIFQGFEWDKEDKVCINKIEKHIRVNVLRLDNGTDYKETIKGFIKELPSIASILTDTFIPNSSKKFKKNIKNISGMMQKVVDNPESSNIVSDMFSDIVNDDDGGDIDMLKVIQKLAIKAKDPNMSERLKKTLMESTGMTVKDMTDKMKKLDGRKTSKQEKEDSSEDSDSFSFDDSDSDD